MLIPFSNLKDYALLLSNVLRDFDPQTMFWHSDNPILFPNYDKDGFTPYKDAHKPFGVQIILESFSRSCGYKSYNALLADQYRPEILDVHLNDLNPAPRNAYFTALWMRFIKEICDSVHSGYVNQSIPSYLTYRNFKPYGFQQIIPFMGWGFEVFLNPNKEIGRKVEYIDSYYPIALSMLFTALEMGMDCVLVTDKKLPKARSSKARYNNHIQNEDVYCWQLNRVPLKKFLTHEQWQDPNFLNFKVSLSACMSFLFDTTLTFEDQGDDPLNCLVTMTTQVDVPDLFANAKKLFQIHSYLRKWAINECAQITDQRYYTSLQYKAVSTLNSSFVPTEFSWIVDHQLSLRGNNISGCAIYGTKAFWLNHCWHTWDSDHVLMRAEKSALEQHARSFITYGIKPYKEPIDAPYQIEYYFEIQGVDRFVKDCNGLVNHQDIPKKIVLKDDFNMLHGDIELDMLKLAIHSQIMSILPRDSFDFEMHSKRLGNSSVIKFDPVVDVENAAKMPKLKIKPVKEQSKAFSAAEADLVFNFSLTQIIHSICIERIPDNLIQSNYLKPYKHPIGDQFDYFDFASCDSNFDDFMFTTDQKNFKHYCMFNIGLVDTPYKVGLDLDPMCGWNQFSVLCEIYGLDYDDCPDFELSLCYSDEDKTHKKRLPALELVVDALNGDAFMEISTLIKDCLRDSRLQWKNHKSFLKGQGKENSNLDTLYQFITYHPNSIEYL